MEYRQGLLTYVDKDQPFVYLQLLPESESIMEQINKLIDKIIEENKQKSSYEIGDFVIAQFTEDNNYYRARIESYSDVTQTYKVYFLDYGNYDDKISQNHLYSCSNELKQIEPQVYGYLIEKLSNEIWINKVRLLIEEKLNYTIEFYFINELKSIIHVKFDNENQLYQNDDRQPKTFTATISATNNDCFYVHILPDTNILIDNINKSLQTHIKEHQMSNLWSVNDLCIVHHNEQDRYYRGKILSINHQNNQYDIQCIDYGNIISNITNDNIYLLTNNDLLKQLPLARQCRLHGVNQNNQIKAIEEIIQHINSKEYVTITADNDQHDQCMYVMLFRENNEIVNDQYQDDIKVRRY